MIDNLVPLCETHHHLVHEGGWNLTLTPDRTLTWTRPNDTIWHTHQSINRKPPPPHPPDPAHPPGHQQPAA